MGFVSAVSSSPDVMHLRDRNAIAKQMHELMWEPVLLGKSVDPDGQASLRYISGQTVRVLPDYKLMACRWLETSLLSRQLFGIDAIKVAMESFAA